MIIMSLLQADLTLLIRIITGVCQKQILLLINLISRQQSNKLKKVEKYTFETRRVFEPPQTTELVPVVLKTSLSALGLPDSRTSVCVTFSCRDILKTKFMFYHF